MRKELEWYYERNEEVKLVGTYQRHDKGFPLFTGLTNLITEEDIDHLHVKPSQTIINVRLKNGRPYILRGYVVKYKREDKTEDFALIDVIIEEV